MPYGSLSDGLYLIKRPSHKIGIEHYGILDVGNVLRRPQVNGVHPIVIHQTPPRIRIDWLTDTGWSIIGRVHPNYLSEAIERVKSALRNPAYDIFSNNCEQFARFIAEGEGHSTQLRWAGVAVALIAVTIFDWDEKHG